MIETDPIHLVERTLATEFAAAHRRVFGWPAVVVQTHFRADTVVCLIEAGEDLPVPDARTFPEIEAAVDELLSRVLGRGVQLPYSRARISPRELLVVMRLR
jgi:hypothetical protein